MKLIFLILLMVVFFTIILAQPSFPNAPSHIPIGGLGLLAEAGGAMSIKKFMDGMKLNKYISW
jgi:hypothetical protein